MGVKIKFLLLAIFFIAVNCAPQEVIDDDFYDPNSTTEEEQDSSTTSENLSHEDHTTTDEESNTTSSPYYEEVVEIKSELKQNLSKLSDEYHKKKLQLDFELDTFSAKVEEMQAQELKANQTLQEIERKLFQLNTGIFSSYDTLVNDKVKIMRAKGFLRKSFDDFLQTKINCSVKLAFDNIFDPKCANLTSFDFEKSLQQIASQEVQLRKQEQIMKEKNRELGLLKEKHSTVKDLKGSITKRLSHLKNKDLDFIVPIARLSREYKLKMRDLVHEADKKFTEENLMWLELNTKNRRLPKDAVAYNHNNSESYIIRDFQNGVVGYGKFLPSEKFATILDENKEREVIQFEVNINFL